MIMKRIHLLIVCLINCAILSAQSSTFKLFANPGLEVYHYYKDFSTGSTGNAAMLHSRLLKINGHPIIEFNYNNNDIYYMLVEEDKVYRYIPHIDSKILYYDFGAEIGDTIKEGVFKHRKVFDKYMITTDEGQDRIVLEIGLNYKESEWVQGIGDTQLGLLNGFGIDAGDEFSCAKINGETILSNPKYSSGMCDSLSCQYLIPDFQLVTNGLSIELLNQNTYGEPFLWDFGDGNTSTSTNPKHSYTKPGCYKVQLISNDICGNEITHIDYTSSCDNGYLDYKFKTYSREWHYHVNNENYVLSDSLYKINDDRSRELVKNHPLNNARAVGINYKMWDQNRGMILNLDNEIYITDSGDWTLIDSIPFYIPGYLHIGDNGKAWIPARSKNYITNEYEYYFTQDYGLNWETKSFNTDLGSPMILFSKDNFINCTVSDKDFNKYLGKSWNNGESWEWQLLPQALKNMQWLNELEAYGLDNNQIQ